MQRLATSIVLVTIFQAATSLIYDPEQIDWNLNQNQTAQDPLDYWGQWPNHSKLPNDERPRPSS